MQKELEKKLNELKLAQKTDKKNQEKDQIAFDKTAEEMSKLLEKKNKINSEAEDSTNKKSNEPKPKLTVDELIAAAKKRVFDDINKSADAEIIKSKQEQLEADKETLKEIAAELERIKQERSARKSETEENISIVNKLQTIGLKEGDFKEIPEWEKLSDGEKLLAIEQISQDALSKVKEIGEQRFQEQNKISFSRKKFNPLKFGKKILKNISKSVWISKEEKQAIKDLEEGKIKPNSETVKQVVERTADMNLDVVEKDGKAFIEFIKIDKNLSEAEQKIIEEYNKAANEYARMPDSWRNKKAANSKDKNFLKNKSYENYKKIEATYDKASFDLLNSKKEQYVKTGLSEKEAELKAMLDLKDDDFQISALQFLNTNPDVNQELKNIRNKSSWGRLFDNENIWRLAYMGTGWAARTATISTLGFIAAPLVAGAVGGARARRKAGQKINTAFLEGRTTETFTERKQANKKGLFTDKNENKGLFSKTLSGEDINAKEVGAFIDADSQIQRLNNLIQKIEEAKTQEEKLLLKDQLNARVGYIEEKQANGLINYGTKNALNLSYELYKNLSFAQAQVSLVEFLDETQKEKNDRRESLLIKIINENLAKFDKKQANFKNKEMIRGAAVAAGFSILGHELKDGLTEAASKVKEIFSVETVGETLRHNPEDILSEHTETQPAHNVIPKQPTETIHENNTTPTEQPNNTPPAQTNPEEVQTIGENNTAPTQTNPEEPQAPIENTEESPQATIPPKLEGSSYLEGNETPAIEGQAEGRGIPETHQNETPTIEENSGDSTNTYTKEEYALKLKADQQTPPIENNSGTYTEEEYGLKTQEVKPIEVSNKNLNINNEDSSETYTQKEYKLNNPPEATVPPKLEGSSYLEGNETPATEEVISVPKEETGTYTESEYEKPTQEDLTPKGTANPEQEIPKEPTQTKIEINEESQVDKSSTIQEQSTTTKTEVPDQTQTQTPSASEHQVDATGHPIEKLVAGGENPYQISSEQIQEVNDLYTSKMKEMFPGKKEWNWTTIQNYQGMAASILKEKVLSKEYQPLQTLMQEIHNKTGLKPVPETGLDSGTSPKEYILKGLQYAKKYNIKIKDIN